jgi:hypothetical protein
MFKNDRKKIKKVIKQTMKDMSDHVINRITDERVPVRTGHYVASHVVQTIAPSYPRSMIPSAGPYAPQVSGGASAMYREPVKATLKAKADRLIQKGEKTIHFGNKASYAHIVEYLGWQPLGGARSPYFIFKGAEESLKAQTRQIAIAAKKKVFK